MNYYIYGFMQGYLRKAATQAVPATDALDASTEDKLGVDESQRSKDLKIPTPLVTDGARNGSRGSGTVSGSEVL